MERLDSRAIDRVSGPAWDKIRSQFVKIHNALISASPHVRGELTTIYVKYTSASETGQKPFAVLWIKSSSKLVLGLTLPESYKDELLVSAPPGHSYAELTKYLVVRPEQDAVDRIEAWAKAALEHMKSCVD
jgi:hypothetical protein